MATRRQFWKWHRWKSIGFCLWPSSTCIWNLKLKSQSKLDLCSWNHVVYRQTDRRTDGRTDKVNPVYPPSNFVGRGYNKQFEASADNISNCKLLLKILFFWILFSCFKLYQVLAWHQTGDNHLDQQWLNPLTYTYALSSPKLNSLCVKFCRGNINIYLHFMSLLHTDMTHVLKILPQVRPGPTNST